MADRVGQRLGNYQLTQLLGKGGFAEVYLGQHVRLGTSAAIKVLLTRLVSQQELDRFQQEAQIIAHLDHPHIVRVLDFDVVDETPFLVMSSATGGSLRQRHPRGMRVPSATVVAYVQQVADALQYGHHQRLIHRDIKPENLLVSGQGEILLSDFGIAVVAETTSRQHTQEFSGTAAYAAPEQLQGKPQLASDQYALGIVVYEWLTGTCPFQGSYLEVASQHVLTPPPPLRQQDATIPPAVEQVVLTALAKDPRARFASVQAFATALAQASQDARSFLPAPTQTAVLQPSPIVAQPKEPNLPQSPPAGPLEQTQGGAVTYARWGFGSSLSSQPTPNPPTVPSIPPGMSSLQILIQEGRNESRTRYLLNKPVVTIGRAPSNDIVIPVGVISRHHAEIIQQGSAFHIVDKQSANGIYSQGRPITQKPLIHGDLFRIGDLTSTLVTLIFDSGSGASLDQAPLVIQPFALVDAQAVVASRPPEGQPPDLLTRSAKVLACLGYLLFWISGIVVLCFKKNQNRFLRFHAWQSIFLTLFLTLLLGAATAAVAASDSLPIWDVFLGVAIVLGVGYWLLGMLQASRGKMTKLFPVGYLAALFVRKKTLYNSDRPYLPSPFIRARWSERLLCALSYLLLGLPGLVYVLLRKKKRFVRFHALQSLLFFALMALLTAASFYLLLLIFAPVVVIGWVAGMYCSLRGQYYKLPFVGNFVERRIARNTTLT